MMASKKRMINYDDIFKDSIYSVQRISKSPIELILEDTLVSKLNS